MNARHVLPPLAIASALLCAAAGALWALSYTAAEELHLLTGGRGHYVEVARGRVMYFAADTALTRPGRDWGYVRYADAGSRSGAMAAIERQVAARPGTGFQAAGVTFRLIDSGPGRRSVVAALPVWLPVFVLGVPPVLWLRTRRRAAPGVCRACGYDLRATPNRCPECGAFAV